LAFAAVWLAEAAESRDFSRSIPADCDREEAGAAMRFVGALSAEMSAFRSIVEDAVGAVELNARQLVSLTAFGADLQESVAGTAAAIAQIDRGAATVADSGEALRVLVATMPASMKTYEGAIDAVDAGFTTLIPTIESTGAFAQAMDTGAGGIAEFLSQLQRISRQARLLAINAGIEAAHLGEAGSGFVIVAEEVKKLSSSTAASAHSVRDIERALHDASAQVTSALGESTATVRGLIEELATGRGRAKSSREQVSALDTATADVAAVAAEQSATLSEISLAVERVAASTAEIAAATRRASELDLTAALERLRATTRRYTLGSARTGHAAPEVDELPETLRAAAARLRTRVDTDQREILELVTQMSVAIARNSYEWKAIASSVAALREHLAAAVRAIEQTVIGAEGAARAASRMRVALEALRGGFVVAIEELDRTLDGVSRVREEVAGTERHALATSSAGERAAEILDIIDRISGDTTLLALNAAIEAAHAGDAGSGFGVIADEIKHLADTTTAATRSITDVLGNVKRSSAEMSGTTREAVSRTADAHDAASQMRAAIAPLRASLDDTLARTAEVASVVEQQQTALAGVRKIAETALARAASDAQIATDARRLELAMLGMRAHALAAQRPLGTVAEAVRSIGLEVAAEMDTVFETAISSNAIRLEDCYDTNYQLIAGERIAALGRLFDVSRVPAGGFDPPKFATRYDRAVEDGFNALIDRSVPRHPAVKAMFAVDLNGYCFGHYYECRQAWTGEYTTDLNRNRIKRFFEDALSLRCSRVGLGSASDALGARTPYAHFQELGCTLALGGERPWAIYTYARDTGIVYNDLSVGLFAFGHRVGTIRIIYDADRV